jgi:hypothetical protein
MNVKSAASGDSSSVIGVAVSAVTSMRYSVESVARIA